MKDLIQWYIDDILYQIQESNLSEHILEIITLVFT
jgi:hypothetical protein